MHVSTRSDGWLPHAQIGRYTDYVLKNAFYELDMPIQCDLFNQKLDLLVNGK